MTIKTKDWAAWTDEQPSVGIPHKSVLIVIGVIEVANEGQHAILRPTSPGGIVGTTLSLDLHISQRPGTWPSKENLTSGARYAGPIGEGDQLYNTVQIQYKNEIIAEITEIGKAF